MTTRRVALIQFDAKPEAASQNLEKMTVLGSKAVRDGARWILFHEGTVCDYTPRLADLAENVPDGESTRSMMRLAKEHDCFVSFGLSEVDDDRFYITQVFVGPAGLVHRYRKTWLWHDNEDIGYRNEWSRYDPGTGPERFEIDGIKASCFICADGEAPRCIDRAKALKPDVIFYPNNRETLPGFDRFGAYAQIIGAPMLVTNRTGMSWNYDCAGGCVVFAADGAVLAKANRAGNEEILIHDLEL